MAIISTTNLILVARGLSNPLLKNHIQGHIMGNSGSRSLVTTNVTKNITLITKDKPSGIVKQLRVTPPHERPLVVMLSWLLARDKHVKKYAQIYTNRGFDVVNISITPWQLLWPTKGTQLVARDTLKFIDINYLYSPIMLHGFSVGAYLWGEALVQMAAELNKYQPVIDKVVGQVWDSAADITEIPVGFPMAVFPNNQVMQVTLRKYVIYHMKTFDKVATCHYLRSSQMFHTNIIKAPALFFLSNSDPIGAVRSNQRVRESWESMGMNVQWKCWEKSPHVGHFSKHREEYISTLNNFLDQCMANVQVPQAEAKIQSL